MQSLEDADNDVLEAFIQMCIAEHRKFYAGAALKPVLHTIQGDNWVARPVAQPPQPVHHFVEGRPNGRD